jgi:hypothetical protein
MEAPNGMPVLVTLVAALAAAFALYGLGPSERRESRGLAPPPSPELTMSYVTRSPDKADGYPDRR